VRVPCNSQILMPLMFHGACYLTVFLISGEVFSNFSKLFSSNLVKVANLQSEGSLSLSYPLSMEFIDWFC